MRALVAVYGTLRHGGRLHNQMGTATGRSRRVGTATIAGALFEVSPAMRDVTVLDTPYPGLHIDEPGRVVVELYELDDAVVLDELDELEGFDPNDLTRCEYHRVRVALHDVLPATIDANDAWTYVYVRAAPDPARRIPGGDWLGQVGSWSERGDGAANGQFDASSNL